MAKRQAAVRFGVIDDKGRRAASWKCWAEIGRGKNDVYLACRALGGVIKASFHESGNWLVDYDGRKFPEMFDDANRPPTRFPMQWIRPSEVFPGVTLACRVVVPWHSPNILLPAIDPKVSWIEAAPQGKAVVFVVALTSEERQFGEDWSAGLQQVGYFTLDSGDRVWVTHHLANWTDPPLLTKAGPRFAKGKGADDLQGAGVRAFAMDQLGDGSVRFFDLPVRISRVEATTDDQVG